MELLSISNNEIVTIQELNAVIKFIQDRKGIDGNEFLVIEFQKPIKKIDIVFIAGLILLRRTHKIKFSIKYNNLLQNNRIFEVRQYLMQYQNLFNEKWDNIFTEFRGIQNLFETDFIASESFAPIILLNKNTLDRFFKPEAKQENSISNLCQKYNDKILISAEKTRKKYQSDIEEIKNRLSEKAPILTFIFTILFNKISPFVNTEKKKIDDPVKRTKEILAFTEEYVSGLHELAKNIVEHSDIGEGMITIRAYDDVESDEEANRGKILETHVFDFGTIGIIPKLIVDTTKNIKASKVYQDDLKILNGDFRLKDFIKPSVKTKLNQQLYRDIAHYGLMKFYKLIVERHKGVVESSSIGKDSKPDLYYSGTSYKDKTLATGTSYFFQIPFNPALFKPTTTITPKQQPLYGSPEILQSISELMNIKVIDELQDNSNESTVKSEKLLWNFKPEMEIKNREDEENLFRKFTDLKSATKKKVNYVAISMKEVGMSDSSLLRFLAHLSTNYEQSIILYNLDFELYDKMIENNRQFFQTVKDLEGVIPFWYEDKGILIYTRISDKDFHFADILYGRNEKQFQSLNFIISHTFSNTYSLLNKIDPEKGEVPDCLKVFFYQSALLPFDLLLCNENKKSLFQSNLETLLMQEMIVDNKKENNTHEQN